MGKALCKRICTVCGEEFIGYPKSKFCSEDCRKESLKNTCVICGSIFYGNGKTCSKSCFKKLCSVNSKNPERIIENNKKIKQTKLIRYGDANYNNSSKIESTKLHRYGDDYYTNHWKKEFTETMTEKYGVKHALQNQMFLDKMNNTIKETGLSYRFGTPEHNAIMVEKYGTSVPYKNQNIKNKGIQTCLDKYGVTSPGKLDWVQEKMKKTCIERFGVEYNFQSELNKQKSKQTMLEKYGVENAVQLHRKISNINKQIGNLLDILEDDYEFPVENRSFDLKKGNLLIEINPTITHNSTKSIYKEGIPLKENYHKDKLKVAENHGYKCINIWDWDNINLIHDMLCSPLINIGARQCDVILVTKETADNFLDNYHLQGKCSGDIVRIGLVYKDDLVALITFGKPRYNKKYEMELLRLCFKPGYRIIGGSERLFKYFLDNFNPSSIISYCDRSKFKGDVYTKLNFKLKTRGEPSKHWYNIKTNQHITDNLLRQRGFDQLFGTNYGKGTSNEQLMLDNGFLEVFDCGQDTYVWSKEYVLNNNY